MAFIGARAVVTWVHGCENPFRCQSWSCCNFRCCALSSVFSVWSAMFAAFSSAMIVESGFMGGQGNFGKNRLTVVNSCEINNLRLFPAAFATGQGMFAAFFEFWQVSHRARAHAFQRELFGRKFPRRPPAVSACGLLPGFSIS